MSDEKKCTQCGVKLRGGSSNPFTTCPRHRTDAEKRAHWNAIDAARRESGDGPKKSRKRRDSDGEVLARTLLDGAKDGAKAAVDEALAEQEAKTLPRDDSWLAKFYRLHEALGLNADEALEKFCRAWVEEVTERALGEAVVQPKQPRAPKPKRKPRARPQSPNGALEKIGDDYERARAQAEGADA